MRRKRHRAGTWSCSACVHRPSARSSSLASSIAAATRKAIAMGSSEALAMKGPRRDKTARRSHLRRGARRPVLAARARTPRAPGCVSLTDAAASCRTDFTSTSSSPCRSVVSTVLPTRSVPTSSSIATCCATPIKSPEDSVLRKLLWYRAGGGVSDKQWRDIVSILRVSRDQIDPTYLSDWSVRLACEDLLARAEQEATA